ncbi:MAG TPA: 8-oxo-dGTP diphosphatase [Candidatus Wildermuthbacteria bacterium]|nr:8-oxo-dGTP diphosphatase [Candidatus Wildermuthbacteria bacterium]
MEKLRDATLVFLVKRSQGKITHICLAMKKRGFGMNRWNGVGGKVEENETLDGAAKRETKEEIGVEIKALNKIAELSFFFPHNPLQDQMVHVYFSEDWKGEPIESEEMNPKWFLLSDMPFHAMWPDDKYWVPEVLKGNLLRAMFKFDKGDVILEKEINTVTKL